MQTLEVYPGLTPALSSTFPSYQILENILVGHYMKKLKLPVSY